MESRAKLFGHPIHPMIIVIPLGLFITSVIFDLIYLFSGNTFYNTASFYNIITGVIGGLVAGFFGLIDWLAIPNGTRAKRIGVYHAVGNVIVIVLFFISWLIRRGDEAYTPSVLALIFSFAGLGLGTLAAWFGGELGDRLGVGVDPGANLNAPSSLSNQPAAPRVSDRMGAVPVTGPERIEDEP